MKNVRFFSNKMALVAVVVVSSIMMMSFKSTSTKKELGYFKKVEEKQHSNVLRTSPNYTAAGAVIWGAIYGAAGLYMLGQNAIEDYVSSICPCYAPDSFKIQEDDQANQDKKMSKF